MDNIEILGGLVICFGFFLWFIIFLLRTLIELRNRGKKVQQDYSHSQEFEKQREKFVEKIKQKKEDKDETLDNAE
jgi:hypothetical protein